jgi:hypothetical protein
MNGKASLAEEELTAAAALRELLEILQIAAQEASPQRLAATRYTLCREALLRSELRPVLPGFLLQCLTIYRFHDFIHLYDPRLQARLAFVAEALPLAGARPNPRRDFDVFGDPDSSSW